MTNVNNVLEIDLQTTATRVAFCYGSKAYRKYMEEQFGLESEITASGHTQVVTNNNTGAFRLVIGVKKIKDIYELKGLVVHELNHVVTEWFNHFGFNCDELRSYTLQYLYQEIMVSLDKKLEKKASK